MKNKKISILVIIFLISLFQINFSLASSNNQVTIEKIKDGITKINEQELNFDKKITSVDNQKKEISIELSLESYKKMEIPGETEIIFVLDSSRSMLKQINEQKTRKQEVVEAVGKFTNEIFTLNNKNVKIGIVDFSDDASIECQLTNDKSIIDSALIKYSGKNGSSTNIYSGLVQARNMFTNTVKNKVIVLLTDGITSSNVEKTKEELKREDIYTISLLSGVTEETSKIAEIFGTQENPTSDELYNIEDSDIEQTITKKIYNNIIDSSKKKLTNMIIKDYFPSEIIKNFDIEVGNASYGNAKLIDNYIEWDLEKLITQDIQKLEYKLVLKKDYDTNILNKVITTNENVTINYLNEENQKKEFAVKDSPQVKINSASQNEQNKKDNTIATTNIPNAGKKIILLVVIILMILIIIIQKINFKRFE